MGKQNRRRAAAAAAAPKEPKDESNAIIGEAEMLRDEIDTELLERDTIRWDFKHKEIFFNEIYNFLTFNF